MCSRNFCGLFTVIYLSQTCTLSLRLSPIAFRWMNKNDKAVKMAIVRLSIFGVNEMRTERDDWDFAISTMKLVPNENE